MFTSGEIEIPPGEPGQLSVVLGNTTDAGDVMIVVRNGRNEAVPGVLVVVNGFDDAGELAFTVIVPIATVLGPDEWAFGQAIAPNLDRTADFEVEFFDAGEIGEPVNLEVTDAELRDGVITGTVVNTSGVAVVDFVAVHVACFNEAQIVAAQDAAVDTEILRSGESASFTTTLIDPAACSSFAIYAGGFPKDETTSVPTSESLVATVRETVAEVMTFEVVDATLDEEALATEATSSGDR